MVILDVDKDGLCNDNGATLCLGIIFLDKLFVCNIGDSSMMFVDQSVGMPLCVWKRDDTDDVLDYCSYEDNIARFPYGLR
jgi:serine/threonine protein phosphatase PrpC